MSDIINDVFKAYGAITGNPEVTSDHFDDGCHCPVCGSEVTPDTQRCPKCHEILMQTDEPDAVEMEADEDAVEKSYSGSMWWVSVVLGITLFFSLPGVVLHFMDSGFEPVYVAALSVRWLIAVIAVVAIVRKSAVCIFWSKAFFWVMLLRCAMSVVYGFVRYDWQDILYVISVSSVAALWSGFWLWYITCDGVVKREFPIVKRCSSVIAIVLVGVALACEVCYFIGLAAGNTSAYLTDIL